MKCIKATITIAALTALVAGCGGDSDSDTLARSGQAIDGYLLGAQVCVDVNFNARCDGGEPSATTSSDAEQTGKFTLNPIQQDNRNAPTLVKAVGGSTVDSDDASGNPISGSYDLKAPAGAKVVTPLTTLVQTDAENRLSSGTADLATAVTNAKASVENDLGVSSDDVDVLNTDYVALQQDSDAGKSSAAKQIAGTAQAVNKILQSTRTRVANGVGDTTNLGGKADSAILNTAVDKVRTKLAQVSQQVKDAVDQAGQAGEEVDLGQVADTASNDNDVADSELTNVVNEVAQEIENLKFVEEKVKEDGDDVTGAAGSGS